MRYAIGEIVLVVIGILIAISINNRNEWRKERILEKSVLIELRDNLERNIELIDYASVEINKVNQTTATIIKIITEQQSYPDSLIYHFSELERSGSFLFTMNTNGYESLKNIGFEILSSKDLKNEILSLFEISYPNFVKSTDLIDAKWAANPMWWHHYFYMNPLKEGWIPLNYNSLRTNKKFMTIVGDIGSGRNFMLYTIELSKIETLRVLELINDELKEQE